MTGLRCLIKLLVCAVMVPMSTYGASVEVLNQVQSVEHTVIDSAQKNSVAHHLELGHVTLLFAKAPLVNLISRTAVAKDTQQLVLFFPMAEIKSSSIVPKTMEQRYADYGVIYNVQLSMVTAPIRGVRCTVTYNPSKVTVAYNSFVADQIKGGFVIRFYNRDILQALNRETAILRTAQRAGKKRIL